MPLLLVALYAIFALAAPAPADPLSWGNVVTRTANGCDAFTPVRASDGHHYTSFGDCRGLTGKLAKLSMGFGRIWADLPVPGSRTCRPRKSMARASSGLLASTTTTNSFEVWSSSKPWGPWKRIFHTAEWDINPGEHGRVSGGMDGLGTDQSTGQAAPSGSRAATG